MTKAKLHVQIENEKGDVEIESKDSIIFTLSAFGKELGEIFFDIQTDGKNKKNQYILKYHPHESDEWYMIEEGHKDEGVIQQMKESTNFFW